MSTKTLPQDATTELTLADFLAAEDSYIGAVDASAANCARSLAKTRGLDLSDTGQRRSLVQLLQGQADVFANRSGMVLDDLLPLGRIMASRVLDANRVFSDAEERDAAARNAATECSLSLAAVIRRIMISGRI